MPVTTNVSIQKGAALRLNASPDSSVTDPSISGWTLAAYVSRPVEIRTSLVPLLTLTVGSGITIISASAGTFYISLTAAQTAALGVGTFDYSVWRTDSSSEGVIADGRLTVTATSRN